MGNYFPVSPDPEGHPQVLTDFPIIPGSYADAVGTNLFFVEDPVPSKSDNIFERTSEKTFSLQAKSSKLIQMKRIFVEQKETNHPEEVIEPNRNPNSLRKYTVDQTYQEALDKLLKAGQLPPRTVTDALDNKIMLSRELEMECSEAE